MKSEYNITKQEHLFTSELKLKFCGYGEWVEEPDEVEIEYLGYKARILRTLAREPFPSLAREPFTAQDAYFGGHFCGYVRIPKDHPCCGKDYADIDIDSHYGLTFGDQLDDGYWIGYDCAHSGDYVPTMEHLNRTIPELIAIRERYPPPPGFEEFHLFNPAYRNMQYCIDTCIEMIDQLIEIDKIENLMKEAIINSRKEPGEHA